MKKVYPIFLLILLHFFPNIGFAFQGSDPEQCSPNQVISYLPGKTKGGAILTTDNQPDYATGETPNNMHVSLGFGGMIILKYARPIPNLQGTDIKIYEVSPSELGCDVSKEKVKVWGSSNGINWIYIGEGCQDLELNFPATLNSVAFLKLTDISNPADFTDENENGYDLDGISAVQCPYVDQGKAITPIVECVIRNSDGTYTAKFGYNNENRVPVILNYAEGYNFVKNVAFQNQPTVFNPGRVYNAFSVKFSSGNIEWHLRGKDNVIHKVEASSASKLCVTARISGGGDICAGESATVSVELEGVAPWTIKYKDSKGTITEKLVAQSPYTFTSSLETAYTLESVVDGSGAVGTIIPGNAIINIYSLPNATLTGVGTICSGSFAPLTVNLSGEAPFFITYSDGTQNLTTYTYNSSFVIQGVPGKTYSIISVADANCSAAGSSASIAVTKPSGVTGVLSGAQPTCGNPTGQIKIELTGTAPWTVTYSNGATQTNLSNVTSNPLILDVPAGFTYSLVALADANCSGSVSGAAEIKKINNATAVISADEYMCAGGKAPVKISLNGEPPFNFTYTDGTSSFTQTGYTSNVFTFDGVAGKSYSMVSVKDKNCEGVVGGTGTITVIPGPTASITGSKYICTEEEKSIVYIHLNGFAPFTITYLDGINEVTKAGIFSSPYVIEVTGEATIKLVKISDAKCESPADGKAEIVIPGFNAELKLLEKYCYGSEIYLQPTLKGGEVLSMSWSTTGKGFFFASFEQTKYVPAEGETGAISFTLNVKGKCSEQEFTWTTRINEKINAGFSYSPSSVRVGEFVVFTPDNLDGDSYRWLINKSQGFDDKTLEYEFEQPGKYRVVFGIEKEGCLAFDTLFVEVKGPEPHLFVPNIFSISASHPESRVVKVYGEEISEEGFSFRIYNKWGKVLYQTSKFVEANAVGWDGKANGTTQPIGVYTYSVEGKFTNNKPFHKYGTVTLAK